MAFEFCLFIGLYILWKFVVYKHIHTHKHLFNDILNPGRNNEGNSGGQG